MYSTDIEKVKATTADLESARMPKRVFEIELSLTVQSGIRVPWLQAVSKITNTGADGLNGRVYQFEQLFTLPSIVFYCFDPLIKKFRIYCFFEKTFQS